MESNNPFHIPGKQEVFEALVSGKHLSLHSGELYHYLLEHKEAYQAELASLGYVLVHEQDYFYLLSRDDNRTNDYSHKVLVFIAIMLEFIAQTGNDMIDTLYRSRGFERDQLPHFSTERYKNYMQHLGIEDEKALHTLLRNLHRSGFIDYRESENFLRFLPPCQRFIQLALDVLEQHKKQQAEQGETGA
ncbi:MAG: hypothetical protein R3F02_22090 [Thiolinea sp.]